MRGLMSEQSDGKNSTSKNNVFFYQRVIKWILLPRMSQENPFLTPQQKKIRVQHGKNIYFTSLVVTLALLRHQISHSKNKCFFPQLYNILFPCRTRFFSSMGSENEFFAKKALKQYSEPLQSDCKDIHLQPACSYCICCLP